MYEEKQGPIEELLHLYVDGAFSRRELIRRLAVYTGGVAGAIAALSGLNLARAQDASSSCPAKVPADAEDLNVSDIEFAGEDSPVFGHLAFPKMDAGKKLPGVIVIHENRGLLDHIKDVTRRAARANFVALGVDLLSRQGGTQQFPEPTQQAAAYRQTSAEGRLSDLISGVRYLQSLDFVESDRIGAVGFCAGGGEVWNLAVNLEELAAAVPFYGSPVPTEEQIARIKSPLLGIYAERDRNLTLRTAPVITALLTQLKTFGFHIYEGVGHAFHNDTGPAYDSTAACDAWSRTVAWFNKFLRKPEDQPAA